MITSVPQPEYYNQYVADYSHYESMPILKIISYLFDIEIIMDAALVDTSVISILANIFDVNCNIYDHHISFEGNAIRLLISGDNKNIKMFLDAVSAIYGKF